MRYLFLLLILLLTACGKNEPKKNAILNTLPSPYPTAELLIAPQEMATPTKWLSPLSATTMAIYGPRLTEIAVLPPVTNPIKIDGVTYGLYGKDVTWSAGTDGETTSIGYFVPSGNYRAVNNMLVRDQINIYSPDTIWEDSGYEYAADSRHHLVEAGDSFDIYVPFGWYIKVAPQSVFTLSPLWSTYSASTPESKDPSIIHRPTNIYSPTPGPKTSTSSGKCLNIKGNVNSSGERIYHCPHWRDYDKTNMNLDEGDTYFCSETEAKAAGFRAAEYTHGICY